MRKIQLSANALKRNRGPPQHVYFRNANRATALQKEATPWRNPPHTTPRAQTPRESLQGKQRRALETTRVIFAVKETCVYLGWGFALAARHVVGIRKSPVALPLYRIGSAYRMGVSPQYPLCICAILRGSRRNLYVGDICERRSRDVSVGNLGHFGALLRRTFISKAPMEIRLQSPTTRAELRRSWGAVLLRPDIGRRVGRAFCWPWMFGLLLRGWWRGAASRRAATFAKRAACVIFGERPMVSSRPTLSHA